ncbi:hypothetical protein KW435_18360 [Vibrio fluvialis]|nr:hypothetical protein [Vibrio fluvialis]
MIQVNRSIIHRTPIFLLVFLFAFSVLLDPGDTILGLKKISFFAVICYLILDLVLLDKQEVHKSSVICSIIFISFSIFGALLAYLSLRNGVLYSYSFTFAYILSFCFLVLLPFYTMQRYTNIFQAAIIISGVCLSFITILTWAFYTFAPNNSLFQSFMIYMNYDARSAMITTRQYGPFTLAMIYFKSVVLLFPALALATNYFRDNNRLRVWLCLVFLLSIILSGSRTNILSSFIMMAFIIYSNSGKQIRKILVFMAISLVPILFYKTVDLISANADISVDIKSGDFLGYIDIFRNDLSYLILGDGFGGLMLAQGKYEVVPLTELVYMDLLRWFGIIPGLIFILFLCFPLYIFYIKKDYIFLGSYICYLLVMGTNPLFASSTGMLAMIIYFGRSNKLLNTHSRECSALI